MAASAGNQAVQGRSILEPLNSILEFGEKCLTWIEKNESYLQRRLARWWLERDERRAEGPPERVLNNYVRLQAYVLTAVTGLGYLALTWSTVVLLGGFVTLLGKKDFWCLTAISTVQAAKIFDTLQNDLVIYFLKSLMWFMDNWDRFSSFGMKKSVLSLIEKPPLSAGELVYSILMTPIILVITAMLFFYFGAPLVCIILSAWRLRWRDYGTSNPTDNSKANLTPALDIYYTLVLLQGAFYLLWQFTDTMDKEIVLSVYRQCNRQCKVKAKWGKELVSEYLLNTRRSYTKEPASLEDRTLITYAVGLLESESHKEYMSGARLLTKFIEQGEDVRSLLLLSRLKIQKLIDTLGWRGIPVPGDESQEIRLLVAKIVADVAGNIHLAQFPGAAQCIASLFEEDEDEMLRRENLPVVVTRSTGRTAEGRNRSQEEGDQEGENETSSIDTEGGTYNKLILQGLNILERLATNQHNCRDISNTLGLLSVITAPIYSDTLIQDIKVSACAEVAYGSFKVVHQLIRTPGCTGRELRHEISSSNQAVSNLEKILDPGTQASQELKIGAMEILTEMALDLSINLANKTKDNLITKQLHILFDAHEGEVLKVVAGRNLALMSSKSQRNSLYIIRESADNVDHLTGITFDVKTKNIEHRITAAKILVNLCTHCYSMLPEEYVKGKLLPVEYVKEKLLPKVLTTILSSSSNMEAQQQESPQGNIWNCFGICGSASQGEDEENQLPNQNIQNQQPGQEEEDEILTSKLLEALLSLTLLIYDKMIYIRGFDAMFQENAPAGQFVARLKTIVEENCKGKASSVSLRIVKLCGQIAVSMMQWQPNQYTEHFRDQKFVDSLSKASTTMSKLESCMLVTGTNNCRMRRNARPLLHHLEKEVCDLVC